MRYHRTVHQVVDRGGSIHHIIDEDTNHRMYIESFMSRTPFKVFYGTLLYTAKQNEDGEYFVDTNTQNTFSKRIDLGSGERHYFTFRGNNDLTIKWLKDSLDTDRVVHITYIIDNQSIRKSKKVEIEHFDIDELFRKDIVEVNKIVESIKRSVFSKDFMNLDVSAKYDIYKAKYPLFSSIHPIVLRYMVQASEPNNINFHMKAFRRYLEKRARKCSFIECNEHYVCELFKALNKRYKMNELRNVRSNIVKILEEENKLLKKAEEDGSKEEKRLVANNINEQRHAISEFIKNNDISEYINDERAVPSDNEEELPDFDIHLN